MSRKSILKMFLLLSLFASTVAESSAQIIPQPTQVTYGSGYVDVSNGLKLKSNLKGDDMKAMKNYVSSVIELNKKSKTVLKLNCTGTKKEADNALYDKNLQGYTFKSSGRMIEITAKTPTGLFYGIQTLRQLTENGKVKYADISDAPRFMYRGFMLDCSRHMWTAEFVKKQIDALAYFKMDRLHLHLTDGGGWRMEIKQYPRLTTHGAWRTDSDWNVWWNSGKRTFCTEDTPGAYGGFFTQDELRDIVRYAAERHIVVIPEIEMPGHSDEVLHAYPELGCQGKGHEFCIGSEKTFEFLENVLKEVMAIFPSRDIHIGGDECSREFWAKCPDCQKRMKDNNLKDTPELQSYLTARIERFLNDNGRNLMGWDEILEGKLAPNATVMSWRGVEGGIKASKDGHHVIMSPTNHCYLDYYQDAPVTQPEAMGGYLPLEKVYEYNPVPEDMPEIEPYIDGVQGNLWTELVPNEKHCEYMTYPRILAIAEVGWSLNKTSYGNFRERVLSALDVMNERGYNTFDFRNEAGMRKEARTQIKHLALGKKVIYNTMYADQYSGAGAETLTNGWAGNWEYINGRWQGWCTKPMDVTVDMEKETEIHELSCEFMQFNGPWIYYPDNVKIYGSNDGKDFKLIDERTIEKPAKDYVIDSYVWKGTAKARFFRIVASQKTRGGWVFANEIIMR